MHPIGTSFALWAVAISSALSTDLTYEADVRPILKAHCFHCHGENDVVEANLDLRLRRFIVHGGDSGTAVVPSDAESSLLVQRVADGEMPPEEDRQLSNEEIEILRRWVDQGAVTARDEPLSLDDETYFTEEERNWWSFRQLSKPPLPATGYEIESPVDAFILFRLSELDGENQQPPFDLAPVASRQIRMRRLYLDLLGIPPTPDQIQHFVEDDRANAWERLVDDVLASPLYGERWGRHWLDVVGYADSEGYTEEDRERPHAWRYRDYVIDSLNEDKPYDNFVVEQLAGDELVGWPHADLNPRTIPKLTATGFLRMAPDGTASSGVDQDEARNQVIADTLQVVGEAFLGMTVQCAQCHDHRYDPIPQRDYYRLRAVFEPALDWKNWKTPPARLVSLYSDSDKAAAAKIEAKAQQVDQQRKAKVEFYIDKTLEHELLMVADDLRDPLRQAFKTPVKERSETQKKLLEDHTNVAKITEGSLYLYDRRRDSRAKDLDTRHAEKLVSFLQQIRDQAIASLAPDQQNAVKVMLQLNPEQRTTEQQALVERHPALSVTAASLHQFLPAAAEELQLYKTAAAEIRQYRIRDDLQKFADQASEIRKTIPKEHFLRMLSEQPGIAPATFVFARGNPQQPKSQVKPRGLSVIDAPEFRDLDDVPTTGRRQQFARYLTSGKHPLLARVMANRLWTHHFGRGIVPTTGDFGFLGTRPSHPDLLDWLATELMEGNWSLKRLHRVILTSRTYQQSSIAAQALRAADNDNRWLGRWPLRRLEAEVVRDAILAVAGRLNTKMHGEPVPVMEDAVGQIVLGKENLDGERKPTKPIPLLGEEFRRSVYVQVRRSRPLGVLENFDLPDLAPNCTERAKSNVAPQSLQMMNGEYIIDMANAMAARLMREHPDDPDNRIRTAWYLCYGQSPSDGQIDLADGFIQRQSFALRSDTLEVSSPEVAALASFCQALMGSNRFLYIE